MHKHICHASEQPNKPSHHVQELQPHVAIKQLELDLQDPQRSTRGTALLPGILWTGDQPTEDISGAGMSRGQYLDKVLPHLTALEQV